MNERFVAVSTVLWSGICGCSSKPRRDFSVTRGWQQMMNAIALSNLLKKSRQRLSPLSERDGSSEYCNASQYGIDIVTG